MKRKIAQRISATDVETPKSVNLATVPISVPGSEPAETTIVPPTAPAVAATEKATPAVSTVAATVNAPSTVQAVARAEIVPPAVITVAATEDVSLAGLPEPEKTAGRKGADIWKSFVKESTITLLPKEKPFTLDSGELCVTIPNVVVEKNKKAWECFIIGKFYEKVPPRGAVHAIVNGIWSLQRRDISVTKMDGNAFLLRVPCPNARRHILNKPLWQIDGQTLFIAKWSSGVQQNKPELEMVPVWLDFTGVPLQFFNRDALKEIAGLVGHPVRLHPSTENLTNIEVAKVYTIIDPRKPLLEFVNASFESGVTHRISVSCPWFPSVCSFCKKVGHTISRCKSATPTCTMCNSVKHPTISCPRYKNEAAKSTHSNTSGHSKLKNSKKIKQVYKPVANQI